MADIQTNKPSKMEMIGKLLQGMGAGMSGFAAPFLGDNDWGQKYRQQMLEEQSLVQKQKAQQAFYDYMQKQGTGNNPPLITIPDMSSSVGFRAEIDPRWKNQLETQQQVDKDMGKEKADYGSAVALLDSLEKDWLATSPTRITNNGKFSLLGAGKGALQPAYMAEQWLGSKFGITRNQRADALYIRRVNSLQSRLAKQVIGKEGGNLAYQEQIAAKGGVASIGDSYELGSEMFSKTRTLLKEMIDARKLGFKNITEKWKDEGRILTKEMATEYLKKAGGDRKKAELMATQDRWAF